MRRIAWSVGVLASVVAGGAWAAVRVQGSVAEGVQARLKASSAFARFQFVYDDSSFPTVAMLFNKPQPNVASGFQVPLVAAHGPWLVGMRELFEKQYAEPWTLHRRDDLPQPAVVVLWNAPDYALYAANAPERNGFSDSAHYDRELGAVISFEYGGTILSPHWKRFPELAQLVRAELDAYAARPDVRIPYWVAEGLSAYLASHQGSDVRLLDQHKLDPKLVERVVITVHEAGLRNATLLPLRDRFTMKSLGDERQALIKKVGPSLEKLVKWPDFAEIALGQAWTLVAYLHEGENGKYKSAFASYLRSALSGDGGLDAFERAFPGVDVGGLELAYYRWLFDQYVVLRPGKTPDPRALEGIGGGAASKGASPVAFDPRALAFSDDEIEAEHALALQDARNGRFEGAIAKFEALRARPKVGAYAGKLDKEIMRCKKFVALRDKYLAELAASDKKSTFDYQGKKLVAKVKSIADGKLFLDENKLKLDSIPIASLDPYELARAFTKTTTDGPDGWARYYAYVLAGDEKGAKALKGSPEALELHDDAEQWYPGALKLGAGMDLLAKLVERGEPFDKGAAQTCVATIQELLADYGELAPIAKRKGSLNALATSSFKLLFEPAKIAETTGAKVELLPEGRVRLTYEGDKKEELADFAPDHTYFAIWRKDLGDLASSDAPKIELKGGAFRLSGAGCWRHAWQFEAPVSIRYDVGFDGLGVSKRTPLFMVGLLDDKAENFVSCQGFGSLDARNFPTKFRKTDLITEGRSIGEGTVYSLELSIAGGKATSREDGKEVKQVESGPRTAGGVFLYVHADATVLFHRIVLEGKPDMASVETQWIGRKLAELKL